MQRILATACALALVATAAYAQPNPQGAHGGAWNGGPNPNSRCDADFRPLPKRRNTQARKRCLSPPPLPAPAAGARQPHTGLLRNCLPPHRRLDQAPRLPELRADPL